MSCLHVWDLCGKWGGIKSHCLTRKTGTVCVEPWTRMGPWSTYWAARHITAARYNIVCKWSKTWSARWMNDNNLCVCLDWSSKKRCLSELCWLWSWRRLQTTECCSYKHVWGCTGVDRGHCGLSAWQSHWCIKAKLKGSFCVCGDSKANYLQITVQLTGWCVSKCC